MCRNQTRLWTQYCNKKKWTVLLVCVVLLSLDLHVTMISHYLCKTSIKRQKTFACICSYSKSLQMCLNRRYNCVEHFSVTFIKSALKLEGYVTVLLSALSKDSQISEIPKFKLILKELKLWGRKNLRSFWCSPRSFLCACQRKGVSILPVEYESSMDSSRDNWHKSEWSKEKRLQAIQAFPAFRPHSG